MPGAFPADFLFGASTAAYQIEGSPSADGKGESIWDRFAHTPGRTARGETGDVACDHYRRFEADLDLIAALGLGAYRFSIAWPRVLPEGRGRVNQAGLDFYRRLVEGMLARGIRPLATLYHWDLPQALQDAGGWAARETAVAFAEYATVVFAALGDVIEDWITHNEPWVTAVDGHAVGNKAPGVADWPTAVRVSHHLLLSHGLAVDAFRASGIADGRIGIALNLTPMRPAGDDEADAAAAARADGAVNRWYLDPVLRGRYPADMLDFYAGRGVDLGFISDGDEAITSRPTDFLGVNYYTVDRVRGSDSFLGYERAAPRPPLSEMGWEVAPDALRTLLVRLHEEYGPQPLMITENGGAFGDVDGDDPDRVAYLAAHLDAVARAIADGVPVGGYFVWSLLDNYEWEWGYDKRFGIVGVDYETQARTPRASARWYRDFVRAAHG